MKMNFCRICGQIKLPEDTMKDGRHRPCYRKRQRLWARGRPKKERFVLRSQGMKRCPRCKKIYPRDREHFQWDRVGFGKCRVCLRELWRIWYEPRRVGKVREVLSLDELKRRRKEARRKRDLERRRKYSSDPVYREQMKKLWRKEALKGVASLSDQYVKKKINARYGLPRSAIPDEMIELKREQMLLRRLLKQTKGGNGDGIIRTRNQ